MAAIFMLSESPRVRYVSDAMLSKVDPTQRHIWFETCSSCEGSFFDAGEFRDLSQLTIPDFFKRLVTPERK